MAVTKGKIEDMPSDAVALTPDQASTYHFKIINSWEKFSDVWPLRLGPGMLGAMSAASGVYINNYYRTKLKLGNYGKISSYIPIVVLPAIMSTLYHKIFVQTSIVLDADDCPVCTQTRAASYQVGFGIIYPTLLAPLSSFMFATRHFTYRLPSITQDPKAVLALWSKLTKPLSFPLGIALGIHSLAAVFITYKEMFSFYELQLKLQKIGADGDYESFKE